MVDGASGWRLWNQGRTRRDCNPGIAGATAAEPLCAPAGDRRAPQSIWSRPRMMARTSVASAPRGPSCQRDIYAELIQTLNSHYRPTSAGRPAPSPLPAGAAGSRSGQDLPLRQRTVGRGVWPSVQALPVAAALVTAG